MRSRSRWKQVRSGSGGSSRSRPRLCKDSVARGERVSRSICSVRSRGVGTATRVMVARPSDTPGIRVGRRARCVSDRRSGSRGRQTSPAGIPRGVATLRPPPSATSPGVALNTEVRGHPLNPQVVPGVGDEEDRTHAVRFHVGSGRAETLERGVPHGDGHHRLGRQATPDEIVAAGLGLGRDVAGSASPKNEHDVGAPLLVQELRVLEATSEHRRGLPPVLRGDEHRDDVSVLHPARVVLVGRSEHGNARYDDQSHSGGDEGGQDREDRVMADEARLAQCKRPRSIRPRSLLREATRRTRRSRARSHRAPGSGDGPSSKHRSPDAASNRRTRARNPVPRVCRSRYAAPSSSPQGHPRRRGPATP